MDIIIEGVEGFIPQHPEKVQRLVRGQQLLLKYMSEGSPLIAAFIDLGIPLETIAPWPKKMTDPITLSKTKIDGILLQIAMVDLAVAPTDDGIATAFAINAMVREPKKWYQEGLRSADYELREGLMQFRDFASKMKSGMGEINPFGMMRIRPVIESSLAEVDALGLVKATRPKDQAKQIEELMISLFNTGIVMTREFTDVLIPYIEETARIPMHRRPGRH